MTTPRAIRLKETEISWKQMTVLTVELSDRHLLRRFAVYATDRTGTIATTAAQFATEAAADFAHQQMVSRLATGTMPKEALIR